MATLIKTIILILFASVVFARTYFPSEILYWAAYVVIFCLVPLWWLAAYWVSEKKAKSVLKEETLSTFFVGMVPQNTNNDLDRGRLCITPDSVVLVSKVKSSYKVIWSEKRDNIKSIGTGRVAGSRNGFVIYTNNGETSFTCRKAQEVQKELSV